MGETTDALDLLVTCPSCGREAPAVYACEDCGQWWDALLTPLFAPTPPDALDLDGKPFCPTGSAQRYHAIGECDCAPDALDLLVTCPSCGREAPAVYACEDCGQRWDALPAATLAPTPPDAPDVRGERFHLRPHRIVDPEHEFCDYDDDEPCDDSTLEEVWEMVGFVCPAHRSDPTPKAWPYLKSNAALAEKVRDEVP